MNQKEIAHRCYIDGAVTLGKILQALTYLSVDGFLNYKGKRLPLKGETNLYKLMSRSDPLTSAFLNEKVDLSKLKEKLNNQGLPFAFDEKTDGTVLFFRVKDKELAKNALDRVLKDLKTSPKAVLKTPGKMTFEEKLLYARKNYSYKGKINSKGKGRQR